MKFSFSSFVSIVPCSCSACAYARPHLNRSSKKTYKRPSNLLWLKQSDLLGWLQIHMAQKARMGYKQSFQRSWTNMLYVAITVLHLTRSCICYESWCHNFPSMVSPLPQYIYGTCKSCETRGRDIELITLNLLPINVPLEHCLLDTVESALFVASNP